MQIANTHSYLLSLSLIMTKPTLLLMAILAYCSFGMTKYLPNIMFPVIGFRHVAKGNTTAQR